jgi:hypothetical protein
MLITIIHTDIKSIFIQTTYEKRRKWWHMNCGQPEKKIVHYNSQISVILGKQVIRNVRRKSNCQKN